MPMPSARSGGCGGGASAVSADGRYSRGPPTSSVGSVANGSSAAGTGASPGAGPPFGNAEATGRTAQSSAEVAGFGVRSTFFAAAIALLFGREGAVGAGTGASTGLNIGGACRDDF